MIPPFLRSMKALAVLAALSCCCLVSSCFQAEKKAFQKDEYIVALPSHWQYISLYEADNNVLGFLSDFILLASQRMGFSLKLITAEPDEINTMLETGAIDACFSALPNNSITKKNYLFSLPVFINGTVVVVSRKSHVKSVDDLEPSAEIGFDRTQGETITTGAKPGWILKPYTNVLKALNDVEIGALDGTIINYMQARFLTKSLLHPKYRILLPPLVSQDIHIICPKNGASDFINAIDEFQKSSIKDGSYEELLLYWDLSFTHEIKTAMTAALTDSSNKSDVPVHQVGRDEGNRDKENKAVERRASKQ